MFVEIATAPRAEVMRVVDQSEMVAVPPPGLRAVIAWETGDADEVSMLMVWESPAARGEFAFQRMMPLFESGALSGVTADPARVEPVIVSITGEHRP